MNWKYLNPILWITKLADGIVYTVEWIHKKLKSGWRYIINKFERLELGEGITGFGRDLSLFGDYVFRYLNKTGKIIEGIIGFVVDLIENIVDIFRNIKL